MRPVYACAFARHMSFPKYSRQTHAARPLRFRRNRYSWLHHKPHLWRETNSQLVLYGKLVHRTQDARPRECVIVSSQDAAWAHFWPPCHDVAMGTVVAMISI